MTGGVCNLTAHISNKFWYYVAKRFIAKQNSKEISTVLFFFFIKEKLIIFEMVSGKGTYYASSVAYRTVNTVGMLI